MRNLDIVTCIWLSQEWAALIKDGYQTAPIPKVDGVAVMYRGFAARDYVRNVQGVPIQ